jgi:hypothetical protein
MSLCRLWNRQHLLGGLWHRLSVCESPPPQYLLGGLWAHFTVYISPKYLWGLWYYIVYEFHPISLRKLMRSLCCLSLSSLKIMYFDAASMMSKDRGRLVLPRAFCWLLACWVRLICQSRPNRYFHTQCACVCPRATQREVTATPSSLLLLICHLCVYILNFAL